MSNVDVSPVDWLRELLASSPDLRNVEQDTSNPQNVLAMTRDGQGLVFKVRTNLEEFGVVWHED